MNMTLRIDPSLRRAVLAPTSLFAMGDEVSDLVLEFPHAAPDPDGLSLSLRRDGPSGDVVALATAFAAVESHRRLLSATMSLKTTVLDAWRLEVKAAADAAAESASTASPKKAPSPLQTAWLDVSSSSEVYASCPVPILLRETSDLTDLLVGAVRYDKPQALTDSEKATARGNIGAGEPYDPAPLEARVADLEAKSETDPSFGAWKAGESVALGAGAAARDANSLAIGPSATATGGAATAFGAHSAAAAAAAAFGPAATASHADSVSIGHDAKSNGAKTLNVSAPDMSHVYLDAASAAPKTLASAVDAAIDAKTADLATKDYASQTADDHAEGALVRANAHSDANLQTAKAYADGRLAEAKTYADGKASSALADAKTYSDGKLAEAKAFATDADGDLEKSLRAEIPTKVSELENDSNFITSSQVTPSTDQVGAAAKADQAGAAAFASTANFAYEVSWSGVRSTPTTLAGYGITDGAAKTDLVNKADLGSDGKVPASQLPSYVDDVLEYDSKSAFPQAGETGKIYVDKATNLAYRWGGTAYVEISPSIALGETASTAYPGDKGKAAAEKAAEAMNLAENNYQATGTVADSLNEHVEDKTNPHSVTAAQVGAYTKAEVDANVGEAYTRATSYSDLNLSTANSYADSKLADANHYTDQKLAAKADATAVTDHAANTNNPHQVTATQTGALPLTGGTITGDLSVADDSVLTAGTVHTRILTVTGKTGSPALFRVGDPGDGFEATGNDATLAGKKVATEAYVATAIAAKQDKLTKSSAPTVGTLLLMGGRASNGVALGATSDGTYGALAVKGADNRTSVLTPDGTPVLTQTLGDARYATAEALASLIPESIRKTVDGAKWALSADLVSTKTTTAAGEASCTLTTQFGSATLAKSSFDDRCFVGTMTGIGNCAVWWDGMHWNWGISPDEITSIETPTVIATDISSDASATSLTFSDNATAAVTFGAGTEVVETSHVATAEAVAAAYVPLTRTINGKPLSGDVTLTVADLGANVETDPVFTAWKSAEAVAAGDGATASDNGVAIGNSASASNLGIALGIATSSGGGVAIGNSASASDGGVAIGLAATSSNGGVAIGDNVTASAGWSVVVGATPNTFGFSLDESGSTVVKSLQSFLDQYWKKTDWLITVPRIEIASDGYVKCPDYFGTDGESVCFSADGNDVPSTTSRLYPDGSKVVTEKMLAASAQMTVVDGQPVTVEHGKFYSFKPLSTADAAFTLTTGFDDGLEDEAKIFFDCATAAPNITLGASDVTVLYKEGSLKLTDMAISGTSTPNRYMVELKWFKTSASGTAQKFMVVNAYKVAEATA